MRTIAIGDIHGCDLALTALLREIDPKPDDLLIPLGDYVDRGPGSKTVLDTMLDLAQRCRLVPLIGNHEVMMLVAREDPEQMSFWLQFGGMQTLASYGGEPDTLDHVPAEHFRFMDNCHSFFETESHIFLHANYNPNLPLDRQSEFVILWEHLTTHVPEPHMSGKTAVVGHTPQYEGEILDLGHLVCIDTYCFGGGWLTALDVDTGEAWQADCEGNVRKARTKDKM